MGQVLAPLAGLTEMWPLHNFHPAQGSVAVWL